MKDTNWCWNDIHTLHGREAVSERRFSYTAKPCNSANNGRIRVSSMPTGVHRETLCTVTRVKSWYINEKYEMGRGLIEADHEKYKSMTAQNWKYLLNLKRNKHAAGFVR